MAMDIAMAGPSDQKPNIGRKWGHMYRSSGAIFGLASSVLLAAGCSAAPGAPEPGQESVTTAAQPLTGCMPAPSEVAVFVDTGGGGSCRVLGIGKYAHPDRIGLPNDSMSSYKAGSDVFLKVCSDDQGGGNCLYGLAGASADLPSGWDNVVSSLEVYPRSWDSQMNFPGTNQIAVFDEINYGAGGVRAVLPIGFWETPDTLGIPNDSMSSIRVGPSLDVFLCVDDDFQTKCEQEVSSVPFLGNRPIGNDTVSSVLVQARCGHDLCLQGFAATTSCDLCAAAICNADPYCCSNNWDGQCVSETGSICNWTCR